MFDPRLPRKPIVSFILEKAIMKTYTQRGLSNYVKTRDIERISHAMTMPHHLELDIDIHNTAQAKSENYI